MLGGCCADNRDCRSTHTNNTNVVANQAIQTSQRVVLNIEAGPAVKHQKSQRMIGGVAAHLRSARRGIAQPLCADVLELDGDDLAARHDVKICAFGVPVVWHPNVNLGMFPLEAQPGHAPRLV